jgi:hypothetical protein
MASQCPELASPLSLLSASRKIIANLLPAQLPLVSYLRKGIRKVGQEISSKISKHSLFMTSVFVFGSALLFGVRECGDSGSRASHFATLEH